MILIKVLEQTVRFIITETYTVMSAMNALYCACRCTCQLRDSLMHN